MKNYSYLAGIIDGEGCLKFTKPKAERREKNAYPQCRLTNTDKDLIDYLQREFGGNVREQKRDLKRKRQWQWTLRRPEMEKIFPKILPFLQTQDKRDLCNKATQYFRQPRYRKS